MAQVRINWKLIIVLILAIIAVGVTGLGLRKYHRTRRANTGLIEGTAAYESKQWRQAATLLGQYISLHQTDVDALLMYARSNKNIQPYKKEHLAQAIRAYNTLLRNDTNNEQAALELIELYLQVGMPSEAESKAEDFFEKTGEQQFKRLYAVALTRQRKYQDAIKALMDLITVDSEQIFAFQLLGQITENQPELSQVTAQQWFDRAVEENPGSARAYVLRNAYWIRQGKMQNALEDLERAEKCDLTDSEVRLAIASAWIQLGRFDNARSQLEAVTESDPKNEDLWKTWVVFAGRTGNPEELKKVADLGLEKLGQDNYSFLPLAAESYIKTGELDKGSQCIAKLKGADADRGVVLYLEGLLADQKMNWAEAIEKWQLAIHLGYSSEAIYLNLADTLEQIQNRPMAIQLLRNYVTQHQGAYKVHLRLGQLFGQENRWIEALEQSTAAIQLRPSAVDARIFYLRCRIETASMAKDTDFSVLETQIRSVVEAIDVVETRILLFEVALKQKKFDKAEKTLDDIEKEHGSTFSTTLARAELLALQGKHEQVLKTLETARKQYPESLEVVRGLVWAYANVQQYEQSRSLLNEVEKTFNLPEDLRRIQLWQAELDILQGEPQAAYDRYLMMANANASDVYVRRQLLYLQKPEDSVEKLQKWIDEIKQAEGENGWQWKYEQARLWYERRDFKTYYTRIVEMLESNLSINPDDQASRILLASVYERDNKIQLALSMYRDALTRQPDNIDLVIAAVAAMYRADEYRQAQQLLERVAQKGVYDPRLARYELQNSLRLGHVTSAVETLERIVLNAPGDKEAKLSLALLYIRQKSYDNALDLINGLLKEDPDSVSANAALADLYISQDTPEKALQVCESYLQKNNTLEAHTMRCHLLLYLKRNQEAIQEIETIEKMVGQDVRQQLAVSSLYLSAGEIEKSNTIIQKLTVEAADNGLVLKQAALSYLQQPGMADKGEEMLQKALKKNPNDVQLRLHQSRLLLSERTADKGKQASVILNRLVYEFPRLEAAWVMLGQWALMQNEPGMAIDYVMRGLSFIPDSKALLMLKAQAEAARSPQLAIATLQQLEKRFPEDQQIIIALSRNYRQTDQADKALTLIENKLAYPSLADSVDIRNEWIAALYESGRQDEAAKTYEELSKKVEGNPAVFTAWSALLVKNSQWQDAIKAFNQWMDEYPNNWADSLGLFMEQTMSTDDRMAMSQIEQLLNELASQYPDTPQVTYAMAMYLHRMNKKIQSIPWYEKTIQLNPSQVVALNNLAWILSTEQSNNVRALQLANKGVEIKSNYTDLLDTRGNILMKLQRYEDASEDFEKCTQMFFDNDPRRTSALYHLGKCLYELNRNEQAFMELMKAKQLNRENKGLTEEELQDLDRMIKEIS